jgi:carboxylesterase type B
MVFYSVEVLWTAAERELSKMFISYWTSFAGTANPNTHPTTPTPQWPAFDAATGAYLSLDLQPTPGTELRARACDFWDKVYDIGCNMAQCPCLCNFA